MTGRRGPISRGISSLVGAGAEAYAQRKARKSEQQTVEQESNEEKRTPDHLAPPPYTESVGGESASDVSDIEEDSDADDEDWLRDETQEQLDVRRNESNAEEPADLDQLVEEFAMRHPPPQYEEIGRLPDCVVILPERRPEIRSRGFVRAYAPVLNDCGIDQQAFLDFLDGFDKSMKASPYFHVVNVAVAVGELARTIAMGPSLIAHVTMWCVHTSIEAARRLYISKSYNNYIDRMNEVFFKPHGLYAMIMAWKPESRNSNEVIDVEGNIMKAVHARQGGGRSDFRSSSGKTKGMPEMPPAAKLIFPSLEKATDEEKVNAFKQLRGDLRDYSDRKKQVNWNKENPNSGLEVSSRPEFASKYADPNHPIHQGGLVTVLSGGKLGGRRRSRREEKTRRREESGAGPSLRQRRQQLRKEGKTPIGFIRRTLRENVLYLMIVNMPSEAELREFEQELQKSK